MKPLRLGLAALGLVICGLPSLAQSTEPIVRQLEAVTAPLVGRVGVAAQLIGSDEVIVLNGDETFPMASTYKVAAAVTTLRRVEAGELSLDRMVEVKATDIIAGDNVIAHHFVHPGIQLSVANLIEVMITQSDNSATDLVFDLAGGPAAITATMRTLGIEDMRIDRNTKTLLADMFGLDTPATAAAVAQLVRKDPQLAAKSVNMPMNPDYEADPRDHATPLAMLDLLIQIDSAKAIGTESRDMLLATMSRTGTGAERLKGLLPRGTPVAHKTGTASGVANDVGYITLPDGRRFAIVVFTKSSDTPLADRDRAVAEVARTLYDHFSIKR